jgi:4-hydroxy-tetrahydrodipicolinate synthase
MQAETVARLSSNAKIVGIKEACGDASRVADIRAEVSDDFIILSGEDAQTLEMLDLGATGAISVTANVCPLQMAEFLNCYLGGDRVAAAELDATLQPIHEILFVEPSPTASKWALNAMGKIGPGIRLPLLPLSSDHHAEVRARLTAVGALQ